MMQKWREKDRNKMFWKSIAILLIVLAVNADGEKVKGIKFEDNKIPWLRTPDEGHAELNVSISKQFSYCAWIYMDWIRAYGKFSGM